MLTMTIAIPVSTDQSHTPVSSDRIDPDSQSFAKSFDEGVALQAMSDANPSTSQGVAELPNAEKGNALNMSGESAVPSSAMKSRAIATKPVTLAANGGVKIANGTSDATSLNSAAAVSGCLRAGATFGKALADAEEKIHSVANTSAVAVKTPSSEEATKTAGNNTNVLQAEGLASKANQTVDEIPDGQEAVPPASTEEDISISQAHVAVKDVPSVSSGNVLGKTEPVADTKTAKSQESKGRYKGTLNGPGKNNNVTNKVTNGLKDPEDQTTASTIVAVAVSTPVQQGVINSAANPANATSPAGGQITGAPITAVKSGKTSAHPQKSSANDPLPVAQTAPDEASSSNAASALAKTAPSAITTESDEKNQRAAITASPHAITASELVSCLTPTHGTEAASETKLQAADISAQIAAGHAAHDAAGSMTADEAHRTLMATPTALEVGIANGTHGWLKIRAEMTGPGVVNASLSAASPAAQEMLHRELPSLTAYLQQEQVAVNTVVVHPMVAGAELRSLVGNMGGNTGGHAQQGSRQGGAGTQATVATSADEVASGGVGAVSVDGLLSPAYAAGGRWLSVRA